MIVYAYYGFGKTTLCENNKYSPFIEIDEEFGQIETTRKIKELSKHAILLVNGHIGLDENDDIVIDIAFLPRNVNIAKWCFFLISIQRSATSDGSIYVIINRD